MRGPGWQSTLGLVDAGGIAFVTVLADDLGRISEETPLLGTAGFGPRGGPLAAALAAHIRAWDRAGQPGLAGLHVDAYPRPAGPDGPEPARDTFVIERPATRFAIYHD
jgi:protein-L-isoaspartate(D-aspartate) O-methyltransferase